MSDHQTVVIGLDGAHFELLEPWIEEGRLPNIASVFEEGVTGDLRSVLPPVTSPNWKSYLTGRNPAKFGIFWWENINIKKGRITYPTHRKNQLVEFWELLAEKDTVGIINVPTTHPPKSVENAFIISGAPDGGESGFASPSALKTELLDEFNYKVTMDYRMETNPDAATEEILDLIDLRFEVAKELIASRDIGFLQVTIFYINTLHHFYWDDKRTLDAWRRIDDHVGDLLTKSRNVVLMSDHGSTAIDTVFNINTWLEQEEYLTLQQDLSNLLDRLGVTTTRLEQIISQIGIRDLTFRLAPKWLKAKIPDQQGEVHKKGKADRVDWKHSDAIASGQGPMYLTLDEGAPGYERLRSEIAKKLSSLQGPSGKPICTDVHFRNAVYDGEYIDDSPDIVIDQREGIHIRGGIGNDDVFTDPVDEGWHAENKRDGLFAATGPDFTSGRIDPISILDLAPTLLHLWDCAIPSKMDGEVRRDVYATGSAAKDRTIEYRECDLRAGEIRRIRRAARRLEI